MQCGGESTQVRLQMLDGIIVDVLKVQLGAASVAIIPGIFFGFYPMQIAALSIENGRWQVLSRGVLQYVVLHTFRSWSAASTALVAVHLGRN